MDEPEIPASAEALARRFTTIKNARVAANDARRQAGGGPRRRPLTKADRKLIFEKTDGRCHLCGGTIEGAWDADHVLAHSGGGRHAVDNYLPAHKLCNNYRWHYSVEEFQWILKVGVWARTQIGDQTALGEKMAAAFFAYEQRRIGRRSTTS